MFLLTAIGDLQHRRIEANAMELHVQLAESRSQVRLPTFVWKTVSQVCSLRKQVMWSTLLGMLDL